MISNFSSLLEGPEVVIQTPFSRKASVVKEPGDENKIGVKDVKKMISNVFLQKIKQQNSSLFSKRLRRSGSIIKGLSPSYKTPKSILKRPSFTNSPLSTKMSAKKFSKFSKASNSEP